MLRFGGTMAAIVMLAALAAGCSGSGGGPDVVTGTPGIVASFVDSGSTPAADMVRTIGTGAGDSVTVEVAIGGPTTSTDLYAFAFELTFGDPTVAEYVSGSASMGTALDTSGNQSLQVLATQQGNRVIVGVSKLGGGAGNGVSAPGETAIVQLTFRLLRSGATTLTLGGSPGSQPAALDSGGADVATVQFDAAPATLVAN